MPKTKTPAWATEILDRHVPVGGRYPLRVEFHTRELATKAGDHRIERDGVRIRVFGHGVRPEAEVRHTFVHEVAHHLDTLAGTRFLGGSHGKSFRAHLRSLEHAEGLAHDPRYTEHCAACGYVVPTGRETLRPGTRVTWQARGVTHEGVVQRVNRVAVSVKASLTGYSWRVSAGLLTPVSASLAADASPAAAPPRPAPVAATKCRHRWVVASETVTGRSASGRVVYSVRDQTCAACGDHQPAAKWSKTVR